MQGCTKEGSREEPKQTVVKNKQVGSSITWNPRQQEKCHQGFPSSSICVERAATGYQRPGRQWKHQQNKITYKNRNGNI